MQKVAFQGERGAFSEDAVLKFFSNTDLLPLRTFTKVFESVLSDEARFGVVPVENSQAGSINETYDLLLKYDLNIYGETHIEVNHCLLALHGESRESITTVYSHPQALAQCHEFLSRMDIEIVPSYDTAGSAKLISENKSVNCAAVASRRVAQIYNMQVLAENIQTIPGNYTRFVVISKEKALYASQNKTSLVFATENIPGALYQTLGAFATKGINLTKIESRPSRGRPWDYVFYVDLDGHIEDAICTQALSDLQGLIKFVKILGSYPRSTDISNE